LDYFYSGIRGVGVGIALDAFIAHGLRTTAVEIDPAVYRLARKYFALSKPDEVYLEDARRWVSTRAAFRRQHHAANAAIDYGTRFDFIIHDCFSGGGVPPHLFTIEFWEDLKEILDPTGVVAVVCPAVTTRLISLDACSSPNAHLF
jgi:spermidine synthase